MWMWAWLNYWLHCDFTKCHKGKCLYCRVHLPLAVIFLPGWISFIYPGDLGALMHSMRQMFPLSCTLIHIGWVVFFLFVCFWGVLCFSPCAYWKSREIIPGKVNNYKRVATKCTIKFSRSKEVSVTGVLRMWQSMGHGEPDREKQVGPTNTGPWSWEWCISFYPMSLRKAFLYQK